MKTPWGSMILLLLLSVAFVAGGIDYLKVRDECARDHGTVVKGGNYLTETGVSGYVCVDKGGSR